MGLGLRFMDACMGFRDVGFRGFGVCVCVTGVWLLPFGHRSCVS